MSPSSERPVPASRAEQGSESDPLRPSDHIDAKPAAASRPATSAGPRLDARGWARFLWRQLTSMRTAIVLLLLLAVAAVPGSLVPQRSSDPNGVIQVRRDNPDLVWLYDALSLHDVYGSPWFSAIYLLLFTSLVGCVVPRLAHHWRAMRAQPPATPSRLARLVGYQVVEGGAADIDRAERVLRSLRYRTARYGDSVSAERGYLRETGNLLFHISLLGMLLSVGLGSGFIYSSQRLIVEGEAAASTLSSVDSFTAGRWVDTDDLPAFAVGLDRLDVVYEEQNTNALGAPLDFTAHVRVTDAEGTTERQIKVNEPIQVGGSDVYLVSNGYAPHITVTAPDGTVVFDEYTPFLAQTDDMASLGVLKLPQGLAEQVGLQGFFYPTVGQLSTGALTSIYPDLVDPVLTLRAFSGDLGLDSGVPQNVYSLETDGLTPIAGGDSGAPSIELRPGESTELPGGLGTIAFDDVRRYAVLEMHHDPTQTAVLVFAVLIVASLLASLLIPRRRVWVKATAEGLEVAGLARGDDPTLEAAVADVSRRVARSAPAPDDRDRADGRGDTIEA